MCDPVSLFAGQVGLSAVGGLTSYRSASNSAKLDNLTAHANNQIQFRQREQQILNNKRNAADAYEDSLLSFEQNMAAMDAQIEDAELTGLTTRSTAAVSANEAGVSGKSVQELMQSYWAQQGRGEARIRRNQSNLAVGTNREMEKVRNSVVRSLEGMPIVTPQPTNRSVSATPYVINFATNVLGGINNLRAGTQRLNTQMQKV